MHQCTCGCSCHNVDTITPEFRRSISNIVVEKFDGDIYAYIKSLHDSIETLENNLDNMTTDFLGEAA